MVLARCWTGRAAAGGPARAPEHSPSASDDGKGVGVARFDETERPEASRGFYKGHGLGNDYLVVEAGEGWTLDPGAVAAVCERWQGPGGDGVVALLGRESPFALRMFNPDGSEFERSGNGLRVLASYLHRRGLVADEAFEVSVGGDTIRMRVFGVDRGEYDVAVDMGRARTGPEAVELDPAVVGPDHALGLAETGPLTAVQVAVGNPHCVVWGDPETFASLKRATLDRIGPVLCQDAAFRRGTNVQLARALDEATLEALVWERGVGHTSASGTSACAVAVAAVASGRMGPGDKSVRMEGGTLHVSVSRDLDVVLRGPVQAVYEGTLDEGFAARSSGG
jgi:diaminopimelate epimerase